MKVVITDYPDVLGRNLDYEKEILESGIEKCRTIIYPYRGDREEFKNVIADADAVLTAFVNMDQEILDCAEKLKCVCFNATGYDFIDYETACRRNIGIVPIGEYCTGEVADHTMALILTLLRGVKHYTKDVEERKTWQYYSGQKLRRLSGMQMGIFGLGKIGRAVAGRAQAFGIRVVAYDPYLPEETAKQAGIGLVDIDYILENCHIISNHMNQTTENHYFFNKERFERMKQKPVFINVGRGGAVDEKALAWALEQELLFGAGLDVLEEEKPDLDHNALIGRENVIITPHAAFYTEESLKDLQRISCENVVHYLRGEYEQVNRIVNKSRIQIG